MLKEIDNMIDINDQINKKSPSSSIQFSCAYGIVQYVIKINDITKIEVLMLTCNERKMVISFISMIKLIIKSPSSSIKFSCAYGIVQYVIKINDITKIEVLMLYNERKMVILLISIMKLIKYQVLLNSHVHMGLYSTILK